MYPVKLSKARAAVVDLMLVPAQNRLNTTAALWAALQQSNPTYCQLLSAINKDAGAHWDKLLTEVNALIPIDFLNLLTAMRAIALPSGKTPFDYLKAVDWDKSPQQDRFWIWADRALIGDVKAGAKKGHFGRERNPGAFHPDATLSYKEKQLGEANVQLTFHENDTKTIDGIDCVMVEPDIDYYKDLGAHAIFEVIPNALTHSLTNPTEVYVLRWIAGQTVGIPEFAPIYTITS